MMNKGLSEYKIKKIMRYFCEDITASKTAILLNINRNTINRYYNLFRLKIVASSSKAGSVFSSEIECDDILLRCQVNPRKTWARSCWKNTCFWAFETQR